MLLDFFVFKYLLLIEHTFQGKIPCTCYLPHHYQSGQIVPP